MSRSFSNVISVLGFTFVACAVAGCAVDGTSEEDVHTEQSVAVSEIEEEDAAPPESRALEIPVHRYSLPPPVDRRETRGPFPQPWTPDDK
jgi:hypothetical protein